MSSRERRIASMRRPGTAAARLQAREASPAGVKVHNRALAAELLGLAPTPESPVGSDDGDGTGAGASSTSGGADILVVHADDSGDAASATLASHWPEFQGSALAAESPRIGSGIGRPVSEQVAMMRPRTASAASRRTARSGARMAPRPPTAGGPVGRRSVAPPLPPPSMRSAPLRLHSPLTDTSAGLGGLGVTGGSNALLGILRAQETQAATNLLAAAEKGDEKAVTRLLQGGLCNVNERSGLVRCGTRLCVCWGEGHVTLCGVAFPAQDGYSPLHHASNRGHTGVVHMLLTAGADPTLLSDVRCTRAGCVVNLVLTLAPCPPCVPRSDAVEGVLLALGGAWRPPRDSRTAARSRR